MGGRLVFHLFQQVTKPGMEPVVLFGVEVIVVGQAQDVGRQSVQPGRVLVDRQGVVPYPDIVNALNARAPGTGKKGCTIATALNLVNFYGPTNYTIDQIVAAWSSDGMNWRWNFSSCGTKLRVNADSEKLVGTNAFPAIRSEIQAGRPVIVNIGTGNSDNHTVMCYGYKNGGTSYSDFLVMDPIRLTSSGGISTEKVGSNHSLQQAMNNNNHPQGIWCIRRTHSA